MNTEALFLFLILLLGLLLCSFLGGNCNREGFSGNNSVKPTINNSGNSRTPNLSGSSNGSATQYDNYNHYTGSSTQLLSGSTYYGENGTTASVIANSDGTQSLEVTLPNSSTPITLKSKQNTITSDATNTVESYTNYNGVNGSATTFYGPNGETATVVRGDNGEQAIKVTTPSGTYYYNTETNNAGYVDNSTQYYGSTGYSVQTYDGAYGGSAGSVTGPAGNTAYYAQGPAGNTVVGTTDNNYNGYSTTQYNGPYGGSAGSVTGPAGNTAYYAQGPAGNTVVGTTNDDYYNSLPPGIPRSQIPPGQEDLYILKSQVVPPVCPACPTAAACPRQEPCPPCPACARCPEPSFECKKVPNYNAINNEYLPAPVLNDFSQFGM